MSQADSLGKALGRVVLYAILVAIVMGILQWFFTQGLQMLYQATGLGGFLVLQDYAVYVYIIVLLVLGYLIVNAIAELFFAMLRPKYGVSTAAAVRSMIRIIGLGALLAGIAGGVAGGAAGVALGGFIGLVIGFATQQVLGQAVAGLFILLARPFKIGDLVDIAGESEVRVKDISTLFTLVQRKDGPEVLIPSNMIIGSKIVVRERSKE
ncbi:mechanosensitive ion channel domain-containing protein [Thermogladius sp. 4427co]|uniref:mechanosensitive ion channel domain-containing protein n=1 Tax=Thermogladius sp. 4427co TaxID=3450718 RepID=UPI003F7A01F7